VKFLILIHSNPKSQAYWETLSDDEQLAFGKAHIDLSEELAASGELVVAEGLADVDLATRVSVRGGETLQTDGPFAEAKEYVAGLYLVDVENLERAVEIAARTPDAASNQVEVRPVLDMSGWEF